MDIRKVNINSLNKAKYNPRKQLKPGDKEFESLKKSINKYGDVIPIIVNENNMTVIGGHQRLAVLEHLGINEVDAVFVNVDETNEKALNITLNKVKGDWDYEALNNLINELNTDLDDIELTGFSLDELDGILVMDRNEFFKGNNKKKCVKDFSLFVATADKEKALKFVKIFGYDELKLDSNNRMTVKMGDNT